MISKLLTLSMIASVSMGLASAQTIDPKLPTVWVIGDSTANNANHRGWADPFADYFDTAKVNVVNRARAGRSSRTFVTEGLWDKVRDRIETRRLRAHPIRPQRWRPARPGSRPRFPARHWRRIERVHPAQRDQGNRPHLRLVHAEVHRRDQGQRRNARSCSRLTVRNIWKDGRVERGSGNFSQVVRRYRQGRRRAVRRRHQRHRRPI